MKETVDKMGFKRVIVVADGGLNSAKNIAYILDSGNGYIISKSAKGSDKATKAWILEEDGYTANEAATFKSKSKVRKRTITGEDGARQEITEKIVCYWSYGHYLRAMKENESFLAWVDTVREHPDKLKDKQSNYQKYLNKTKVDSTTGEVLEDAIDVLSLDWAKIEQDQALMGYYTIMTSEVDMSDPDIIERYHGLGRIEDAFRTIKTDLQGRPVFVRTPEHIDAHFLICFIALTMVRLIQYRLQLHLGKDPAATRNWVFGLTSKRVKEALRDFRADPLPQGYWRLSEPTDDLKLLTEALGISAELRLPTLTELRKLKLSIGRSGIMYV
jgi:transposase